jgi:hypothetical protein
MAAASPPVPTSSPVPALPRVAWPRLHLAELCDQAWLPATLRDAETDYLASAIDLAKPFHALAPTIAGVLDRAGTDRVVDLGSGGAGPWPALTGAVAAARDGRAPTVTLTDLYPNRRCGGARAGYETMSVDARAVPAHLRGVRTMFDALHHLRPADARAVLADAHRARAPIVIGEAMSRRVPTLLAVLLIPLFVLLLTPRIRPVRGWQLVFTYLVPILPLIVMWDGFVSCLRTYRPAELLALTRGLDGYRWTADTVRTRGGVVTYLVGEPQ